MLLATAKVVTAIAKMTGAVTGLLTILWLATLAEKERETFRIRRS
jgi:hypothetical protein